MWPPRSQPRIKNAVCCERLTREQAATAHSIQNGRNERELAAVTQTELSAGVGPKEDNYTHHRLPFSSQPFPLWHVAVPAGRPTAVGPGQSRRGPDSSGRSDRNKQKIVTISSSCQENTSDVQHKQGPLIRQRPRPCRRARQACGDRGGCGPGKYDELFTLG